MALQDLHDLARLQIPDVRFTVLASCDDPFPARDAEARRDAVLGIDVAGVRFQTPGGLIVPQTDGIVMGSREDVFGVG